MSIHVTVVVKSGVGTRWMTESCAKRKAMLRSTGKCAGLVQLSRSNMWKHVEHLTDWLFFCCMLLGWCSWDMLPPSPQGQQNHQSIKQWMGTTGQGRTEWDQPTSGVPTGQWRCPQWPSPHVILARFNSTGTSSSRCEQNQLSDIETTGIVFVAHHIQKNCLLCLIERKLQIKILQSRVGRQSSCEHGDFGGICVIVHPTQTEIHNRSIEGQCFCQMQDMCASEDGVVQTGHHKTCLFQLKGNLCQIRNRPNGTPTIRNLGPEFVPIDPLKQGGWLCHLEKCLAHGPNLTQNTPSLHFSHWEKINEMLPRADPNCVRGECSTKGKFRWCGTHSRCSADAWA